MMINTMLEHVPIKLENFNVDECSNDNDCSAIWRASSSPSTEGEAAAATISRKSSITKIADGNLELVDVIESCGSVFIYSRRKLFLICGFCESKYANMLQFAKHLNDCHKIFYTNYEELANQEANVHPPDDSDSDETTTASSSLSASTGLIVKGGFQIRFVGEGSTMDNDEESLPTPSDVLLQHVPIKVEDEQVLEDEKAIMDFENNIESCGNVFVMNRRRLFLICGFCESKYANMELFASHLHECHKIFEQDDEANLSIIAAPEPLQIKEEPEEVLVAVKRSSITINEISLPMVAIPTTGIEDIIPAEGVDIVPADGEDIIPADDEDIIPADDEDIISADDEYIISADDEDIISADDEDIISADDEDIIPADDVDIISADNVDIIPTEDVDIVYADDVDIISADDVDIIPANELDIISACDLVILPVDDDIVPADIEEVPGPPTPTSMRNSEVLTETHRERVSSKDTDDLSGESFFSEETANDEDYVRRGPNSEYTCRKCSKKFQKLSRIMEHVRIHTGEKPYKCLQCGKCFRIKLRLSEHLMRHRDVKAFKCEICGLGCSTRQDYTLHKRHHTGDKRYACLQCGKAFVRNGDLKTHLRIHSNERPFKCEICNNTFRANQNLIMHRRKHESAKQFKCDYCDKSFRRNIDRKVHHRTHTGEKAFKCEICNRGYSAKVHVRQHILKRHMNPRPEQDDDNCQTKLKSSKKYKSFKCTICSKAYSAKYTLHKHMKKVHVEEVATIPTDKDETIDDALKSTLITILSPENAANPLQID